MKWLVRLTVLSVVLLAAYPLINEETTSPCHAVEKRFVVEVARTSPRSDMSSVFAMGFASELFRGGFASGSVKTMYPNLPPFAGCYVTYYKMITDPSFTSALIARVLSTFANLLGPGTTAWRVQGIRALTSATILKYLTRS